MRFLEGLAKIWRKGQIYIGICSCSSGKTDTPRALFFRWLSDDGQYYICSGLRISH
jgi:hypothetical protein